LDRKDSIYVDCQQHLPAPMRLSDYTLECGLSVKALNPPRDYAIRYHGRNNVAFDLRFAAIMDPYDINDRPGEKSQAGQQEFPLQAYTGGHFDMSGRVTGVLHIADRTLPVDCIATMDHSWGSRPQIPNPVPAASWVNAHFGKDYVVHAIWAIDFSRAKASQYSLLCGYVLKDGELLNIVSGSARADRLAHACHLATSVELEVTDHRGGIHKISGALLSATSLAQHPSADTFQSMYRWHSENGSVGYGCNMELHQLYSVAHAANL
jgi:hypothetical protein